MPVRNTPSVTPRPRSAPASRARQAGRAADTSTASSTTNTTSATSAADGVDAFDGVGGAGVVVGGGGRRQEDSPQSAMDQALAVLPAAARKMVQLGVGGGGNAADVALLAQHLAALHPEMLQRLQASGYTINVGRLRLSNADAGLKDLTANSGGTGPSLAELAEGVHKSAPGQAPSISVKTYLVDGVLRMDASTLVHEIGHAFDLVVDMGRMNAISSRLGGGQIKSDDKDFADAFNAEKAYLPPYFHTPKEFFAETFALYMLDPTRCKRQFPQAFAAHDKRFAGVAPDPATLQQLEKTFNQPAVVTTSGVDLRKHLEAVGMMAKVMRDNGQPVMPMVVHLKGKADWGVGGYVLEAARAYRQSFSEVGVYRADECLVHLSADILNDAQKTLAVLTNIETAGRAAVLFIDDAAGVQKTAPGFQVMQQLVATNRGLPPLVIAGEPGALSALDGALPTAMKTDMGVEALTASQQASLVMRFAKQESFTLDAGVEAALTAKLKGGGIALAQEAWVAVKRAQFGRVVGETDVKTILNVTIADVDGMKLGNKKTARERLDEMIGQKKAKDTIESITAEAKIASAREKAGVSATGNMRLNLLFAGAPGTGKTTFADILGQLLTEVGYTKNPVVTKVTIQDLISGQPEAAVKKLFEDNKGGVIFIDEMHQLKDTQEGQRAYRALIPLMTSPEYQDTVFIGAGYTDEIGALLRNIDPGGERRFKTVPFVNYRDDELKQILAIKTKGQYTLDAPAEKAAIAFLENRRRTTKNFGNAGEIDVALAHAVRNQNLRLAKADPASLDAATLMALKADDFAVEPTITKAQFWSEMEAMSGWDDIKALLKKQGAAIDAVVKKGGAPIDVFEPYWIVDGPPGTGKSTLAQMLAKFAAAYGLTTLPEVVEAQGANFQGQYVGQTAGAVEKKFEDAWGRLLFVDEVSGLAKSGGAFKDEAAKTMLTQMENHRGKYMMVVADYAHNINQFLQLDPGLARRFGMRLSLKPWTPAEALDDLHKKLKLKGIDVGPAQAQLLKRLTELSAQPGYASGGDVRSVAGAIHAAMLVSADTGALPKAIDEAFGALIAKKKADAGPAAQARVDDAPMDMQVAVAVKQLEKPKIDGSGLSAADEKVIAASDAVNVQFAKSLNGLSTDALEKIQTDPKSDYAKALAKKLGVSAEEAVKSLVKVRVKVKKLVEKKELIKRFQYHCPYCGGVDSPTCGYINRPIEWKIQHSLKKPWTEEKVTQQEIDVIEEREVRTTGQQQATGQRARG